MSLIHEALRKARREAEHRDDPGVVFPGGLTGRGRRKSLGVGVALGILLTLVVVLIAAGSLWWAFRQPATTAVAAAAGDAETPAAPTAAPRSEPTITDRSAQSSATPPPTDSEARPATVTGITRTPTPTEAPPARPVPESPGFRSDSGDEAPDETAAPSTPPPGTREYLVDADLGNITLSLDYIVVSPTDAYAQINGLEVRVGSRVEGFTVEEITDAWVRLRDDQGPLVLRVPPSP